MRKFAPAIYYRFFFTLLQHGTEAALQQRQVLLRFVIGVPGMREHRDDGLRILRKLPRAPHGDKLVPFSEKYARQGTARLPHERPRPADLTEQLKKRGGQLNCKTHCGPAPRHRPQPPPAPTGLSACRRSSATHCAAHGAGRARGRHIQQEQALDRRTHGLLHGKQRPPWNAPRSRPSHAAVRAARQMPAGSAPASQTAMEAAEKSRAPPPCPCRSRLQKDQSCGTSGRKGGQTARATRGCRARTAPRRLRRAERRFSVSRIMVAPPFKFIFRSGLFSIRSASSSNVTNR